MLIVLGVALMVVAAAVLAAMLGKWSTTSVQIILVLPTVIGASLLGWGIGGGAVH